MFLGLSCLDFPICKLPVTGGAHGVVNPHEVLKGYTVSSSEAVDFSCDFRAAKATCGETEPWYLFKRDVLLDRNVLSVLLATDKARGKSMKEEEGW